MLGGPDSSPQSQHSLSRSVCNLDGRVGATKGGSAMLKPTDLDLQRQGIRPGHWGQWLAIGVVGLVGFVVLALL